MARTKGDNQTYLALAVTILKEKNKPLTLKEITKEILERREKKPGLTPEKSVYSGLWSSDEVIKRDGLFRLAEWG